MALIQDVRWAQSRILKALKDIFNALSKQGSTSTTSDSEGTVVRNVRDYEMLERMDQIVNELSKINNQLELLTENPVSIGEMDGS